MIRIDSTKPTAVIDGYSSLDKGLIIAVITGLSLILPLYIVHQAGLAAVFSHFASDAFYYFSVAKRSVFGFYTYDGEAPINGFHPLWQYLLTGLFGLVGKANDVGQLYSVFILCAVTVATGYTLTALGVYRITRSKMLSILIIPGIYNVLISCFGLQYFENFVLIAPWTFINGMESCLSVLFGGWLLYVISKVDCIQTEAAGDQNRRGLHFSRSLLLKLGVLSMFVVMSRLDDIFLVISFSLCLLYEARGDFKSGIRYVSIYCSPLVCALLVYLPFNFYYSQSFLPISGVIKSGFSLVTNVKLSLLALFPASVGLAELFGKNAADIYSYRLDLTTLQAAQMIVPAVLALLFLLIIMSKNFEHEHSSGRRLLFPALLGCVILKAGYNFVNCSFYHQGSWYYVFSIMVVNYVGVVLVARPYRSFMASGPAVRAVAVVIVVLMFGAVSTRYVYMKSTKTTPEYAFWMDRDEIRHTLLAADPDTKILEYADGIVNYSLNLPTMSGMYAIDSQGYTAREEGNLFDYAYTRGFKTLADWEYLFTVRLGLEEGRSFVNRNGKTYRARKIYRHPKSHCVFLMLTPE